MYFTKLLLFLYILFEFKKIQSCVQDKIEIDKSTDFSKEIIDIHNIFRQLLVTGTVLHQPRAAYMKNLIWDNELANTAENVANMCKYQHTTVNTIRFEPVGQNIFLICTNYLDTEQYWNEAIKYWFDEHTQYVYPDNATSTTGHYTQLVWADTEFLGCGYSYYNIKNVDMPVDKQMFESGNRYCGLYVCHYGPTGNYLGQPPYKALI